MIFEVVERFENTPTTLRDLSCQLVSDKVVEAIWKGTLNFQSIYIPEPVERAIREWLEVLPPLLQQELLDVTARGMLRSAARITPYNSSTIPIIIASLVEVLYSANMNAIEIWTDLHWNQEARMKILHLLHSRKSGIKKMVYSCYKTPIFQFQELHFSERFLLMNILNKFPALKVLVMPYVADDELLAKLGGGSCPCLEQLNVEGSWGVTNQGLSALAGQDGGMVIGRAGWVPSHFAQCTEGQKLLGNILKGSPVTASQITSLMTQHMEKKSMLQTLKHLNINGTSTDYRGLECVLQNFRNLKQLDSEEQNWQTLLIKSDCSDCYPRNLPLESLNLSQHSFQLLPHIHRLFPNIRKMTINNFSRSEAYLDGQDNLLLLQNFNRLGELSLTDVDLDEVYSHLANPNVGVRLHTFRYTGTLKVVKVESLAQACPNIKLLSLSNSVMSYEEPLGLTAIFPRMTGLYLQDITFPRDQQGAWKKLISSLKLEHISLQNIRLTDGDISFLVKRGCLSQLKEIHISANFTILLSQDSVYKLLDGCPRLNCIGGICSWSLENLVDLLHTIKNKYSFKIKMGEEE